MKSALILITLASWSTGQLIYPDEFETMRAMAGPQELQSDPVSFNKAFANAAPNAFNVISVRPALSQGSQGFGPNPRANDGISKNVLRFALKMDDAVAVSRSRYAPGSRDNIVFSPLSVAGALALVLLGSAGKTFEEVSTILGLNTGVDMARNSETYHEMFGALIAAVVGTPGQQATQTSFATGIFVKDGYPITTEFKTASEKIYKSSVINLDFQNRGGDAQRRLNAWVSKETRGKIPNILSEPPSPDTSVIIASALYFNGEWNQYFIDGATKRKPFTISPGETVDVDMMYNGGEFPFFEDKQLRTKIVGLPYKGREVTMYVLLPTDPGVDALRAFERRLDPETLENLIRKMENRTCILGLPRMKLSSSLSLKDSLQSLGLNSLFSPSAADLSLVSQGPAGRQSPPPTTGNANFFFPTRFGGNDKPILRHNYFTYDDTVGGYRVEQWATGFSIGRLARQRRRRSLNERKWRLRRSAGASRDELHRLRRQTVQSIDYQNEVDGRRQQSFGIDTLRNNGRLKNPGLYADDVLHRVEIDVTEEGTEAAAATVVLLAKDGNQKRLVADRPFLFFIRHEATGLILFWGTVNKPTPNYPSQQTKR